MRLAKGATKQQAVQEVCKAFFAPKALESVPPILDYWDEQTRRQPAEIFGRTARKAMGLP